MELIRTPSLTSLSASTFQRPRFAISALNDAAEGSTITFASPYGPINSTRSSAYSASVFCRISTVESQVILAYHPKAFSITADVQKDHRVGCAVVDRDNPLAMAVWEPKSIRFILQVVEKVFGPRVFIDCT